MQSRGFFLSNLMLTATHESEEARLRKGAADRYTLGIATRNEPRHFVHGRHFTNVENLNPDGFFMPKGGVNFCVAIVDEAARKVRLDVGNALPVSPTGGPIKNIGRFSLVCIISAGGGTQTVALGDIKYSGDDWYELTAGIVDLPSERQLTDVELQMIRQNPLALVIQKPGGDPSIAISEAVEGIHVRADLFVARLNPGDEETIDFWASRYGQAFSGARVTIEHFPPGLNPPVNTPPSALTFPGTVTCDAAGRAALRLRAHNPGNPRRYIDGHPLAGRSRGKDLSYRKNFVLSLFFFSPSS